MQIRSRLTRRGAGARTAVAAFPLIPSAAERSASDGGARTTPDRAGYCRQLRVVVSPGRPPRPPGVTAGWDDLDVQWVEVGVDESACPRFDGRGADDSSRHGWCRLNHERVSDCCTLTNSATP